ncbi:hypothetical protein [Cytophaga aurantiaca]|uniref:hypothetical protein n=1 Tax=Cytophaga aurantiaca TaxID=29530 RepID=UPI000381C3BC|nr:hypothetical protein [Cytophaga aurantiaca]
MRVILKNKDHYENIYWINVKKSKKETMLIGRVGGDYLDQFLNIDPKLKIEYHFTYPESGDFHHTYHILYDFDEQYINIYTDRINIKRILKRKQLTDDMNNNTLLYDVFKFLSHGVPMFKHQPLFEIESYSFASLGVPVNDGQIKISYKNRIVNYQKRKDDIIVDGAGLKTGVFNIVGRICRKNMEEISYGNHSVSKTIEISENLKLQLFAGYIENK